MWVDNIMKLAQLSSDPLKKKNDGIEVCSKGMKVTQICDLFDRRKMSLCMIEDTNVLRIPDRGLNRCIVGLWQKGFRNGAVLLILSSTKDA